MSRITKYEPSPNSKFPYKLKDDSLATELDCVHKLGKLEDLEEQIGCPLEIMVKAFKKYVEWTTDCDFGYDNIPDEYEKYKDDNRFKILSYDSGLIYIAIQETLKEEVL